VQVLEVERLELDHLRERQRVQLEDSDQQIAVLREQLRLRNEHIRRQRELLSAEQQKHLRGPVSMLGSTLSEPSPVQQRGPLRVMHAWAPPPLEEDLFKMDRASPQERPPAESTPSPDNDGQQQKEQEYLPLVLNGLQGIDWRNVQVPRASQIRGIARIQPPGSCQRLAPKGWREPPELRPSPQPPPIAQPIGSDGKPATSSAAQGAGRPAGNSPRRRGNTCPPLRRAHSPLRRPASLEGPSPAHRRISPVDEMADAPRRGPRGSVGIAGAAGGPGGFAPPGGPVRAVPVPAHVRGAAREYTPGHHRRRRARSEQAGHLSRLGRAGQGVLHTPGR